MLETKSNSDLIGRIGDLGFDLLREVSDGGNSAVCPLSVGMALAMLIPGARGKTREELARCVGADELRDVADLLEALPRPTEVTAAPGETAPYRLTVANAAFTHDRFHVEEEFLSELRSILGVEVFPTNFDDAEGSAERINGWVSRSTNGLIPAITDEDAIHDLLRLVLINAVHFKGTWRNEFEKDATAPAPFHGQSGTVDVPMMALTRYFSYVADPERGVTAIRLPYRNASMIIIVPDSGEFGKVADGLDVAAIDGIVASMGAAELAFEMPRFEIAATASLVGPLQELGLHDVFEGDAADLSGITPHGPGLVVDEVKHAVRIIVDEEGTEAAAVTSVDVCELDDGPLPTPFRIDRPFLFTIRDDATGLDLFIGSCVDL